MPIMKNTGLLMASVVLAATASTVSFKSGDGQNEWNNSVTHDNVLVTYNSLWTDDPGGGEWISYADTGMGKLFLLNDKTNPFATFTEQIDLPASTTPYSFNLNVWADDTAAVYLNGKLLQTANFTLGAHCSDGSIGCIAEAGGLFNITSSDLVVGLNLLQFDVFQLGGDSAGLVYSGSVSGSVDTPEPATFVLLGVGLAAIGLLRCRHR